MINLNKFLIFVLLVSIHGVLSAKKFEGSITVVKESCFDTTFYTYYVSDGRIRIEELNSKKVLQSVCLINTNNEEVFVINPEKKLYTKLHKRPSNSNDEKQFTINKTSNYKLISGNKCYQWRVKNIKKNTEISYWVTQNDFGFFEKMVKVLNNTDQSWEFYNHIPESEGYFPILSEERNLVRDEKMRTEVLTVTRKPVDSSIFRIPSNYRIFAM